MKKQWNRWISSLLAVVMVLGFAPNMAPHVHAEEVSTKATYRWEPRDGALVSVEGYTPNALTKIGKGTVGENGELSNIQYQFADTLELSHDEEWYVEWEGSGVFSSSGMLLSKTASQKGNSTDKENGNQFILGTATWISLGNYWDGSSAKNNAVTITAENTKYRLENRVETDAEGNYLSNMVYWVINGDVENAVAAGNTSKKNYLSGDDVVFNYIGATGYLMTGYTLDYLQVYDPSVPAHVCDYTTLVESVKGDNCTEGGYDIKACACGATAEVEGTAYGDHTYGAWANVDGVARRDCDLCDAYETATYVWQMNEDKTALVYVNSGNEMTPIEGDVNSGVLTGVRYALAEAVNLDAEAEWVIEFKGSGNWQGMILSKTASSGTAGNQFFFRTGTSISLGNYPYSGGSVLNYFMVPTIDYEADTVYRLENKVTLDDDGAIVSNMPSLWINGVKFSDVTDGIKENYVSGTDLTFNYIGGNTKELTGLELDYLMINPGSVVEHTHSYTTKASDQLASAADCENAAAYYVQCDRCDAVSETLTVAVGEALGHADENKDHTCDRGCGKTDMGTHADAADDEDHLCDYGCGAALGVCSDAEADGDHACDSCGKADVTGHTYGSWTVSNDVCSRTCAECDETQSATYVWQMNDAGDALLDIANGGTAMTNLNSEGSVANGLLTKVQYALAETVTLAHDVEWAIEFKGSGDWKGMLFATNKTTPTAGNQYFMRSASTDKFNLGHYNASNKNKACWVSVDVGAEEEALVRLENRVTRDESENWVSNEIYLIVNGTEYDATDGTNYASGTDLVFNYIGSNAGSNTEQWLTNLTLDYLMIDIPAADSEEHTCEFTTEVEDSRVAATCMAEGSVTMKCECGKTKVVTLEKDPTKHTGNNTITGKKEATCGEAGYTGDTYCECSQKVATGEPVPATGEHNHSIEVEGSRVAATCVAEGSVTMKCVCGNEKVVVLEKDPTNHAEDPSYVNLDTDLWWMESYANGHKVYYPCCQNAEDVEADGHEFDEAYVCRCGFVKRFLITWIEPINENEHFNNPVATPAYGEEFKSKETVNEEPVRAGHTFTGWKYYKNYDEATDTYSEEYTGDTMPAFPLYADAQWDTNAYTVTWIVDGEVADSQDVYYGDPITAYVPTKAAVGCTAYEFSGWDNDIPDSMPARGLTFSGTFASVKAHTSEEITYENNGDTHDAYHKCCGDLIKAGAAHEYDNETHLCDCGAQEALYITQQPTYVPVRNGQLAVVSVEAHGEGLKYEWWLTNANGDGNWYKSAVKSRTYAITMTNARADRQVYCKITDKYGNTVQSETVTLYREPTQLKILTQPTSASAYLGELCRVTMEVQGDGLKYQWYLQNNNGNGDTNWYESAVQSKNYSVTMTNYRAERNIYCVITDAYGNSVTTDTVTLHRLERPLQMITQPTDGYAKLGEINRITMDVQGDGLKYQWYLSSVDQEPNPETWYASAVKSKNYSIGMNRAKDGQYLFCQITDAYGNTMQTDVVRLFLVEGE